MIQLLTICYLGAFTLGASINKKIRKLDDVIHDLEREVEVLAELKDESKIVMHKGSPKDIYEVNKEDGTDEWMTKFCEKNNCEEQGGDMILSKEQVKIEKEDNKNYQNPQGDPIRPVSAHWKKVNGRVVVPFAFASSIDANTKNVIREAIQEYKTRSCVDWTETTDTSQYHVEFIKGQGCYSYIGDASGFLASQGKQPISIGNGCAFKGTVIHEMLHCMGFFHEQSRPDRDDYVAIYLENLISQNLKNNFDKQSAAIVDSQGIGYDINSVMHYGPDYFAKQGTYTILKKVPGGDPVYFKANREDFSPSDIKQLNLMYKCPATPVATEAPPTEAPSEAPETTKAPTEAPETYDNSCPMMVDLGFCNYRLISDKCPGCAITTGEGLIKDRYSTSKCAKWAEAGYCEDGHKYRPWMFANCLKQCIATNYPPETPSNAF